MIGSPCIQGTLKSLLQQHSSKASILQCSAFFIVQLSHPYMTTEKTIALTRWTFVGNVISQLFNMLSDAAAKSLQSCPTLCIPIDGSPPGASDSGILQARILEWIAISFSNAWKWKVTVKSLSRVWLLVTPWTAAYQSAPSMEFSRQEYWSGLPLPSLDYLFSVLIFCFVSNNSNNCNFLSFLIIFKLLLLVSYFLMGFMFDWELFLAGL